jgi:outer membrane protein assembly factor BamB
MENENGGFMKTARLFCVALMLGMVLLAAGTADWPQWRGPRRDGISQEKGLLKEWPKGGPKLIWQLKDIGDGYGAPSVAGARLYLVSNRGLDDEFVQALSVHDGKQLWSTSFGKVGNPDQKPSFPKARSTPTVDGKFIYVLSSDGDLACLGSATGKALWRKSLRKDFGGRPGIWAYAESPLIDGDMVIVTPGGSEATLAALNKRTGATIWKCAVPGGDAAGYSSVIVVDAAGPRQYVQSLEKGLVGVDAKTGRFLWRYDKLSSGPANIPTPVARDTYVYNTNPRQPASALLQLKPSPDGVTAEQVYLERGLPNDIGGQVLVGDFLYGTNPEAGLMSVEFLTGKIRWKAEGIGSGSLLYADGCLYLHGENGDVALVEATPEGYREKGRFTPPEQPKHPGGPMEKAWPYPVVADGRLYIRDLNSLWCYAVASR